MSKDPFQILADEITLIRSEIEKLQRTSRDKDEAKALHDIVATGVADMRKISPELQQILDARLREAMADVKNKTRYAAHEAAESAVIESHAASVKAAQRLLDDAATARRQAWRTFGSFWAWMIASVAVGVCVGFLGAMALNGWAAGKTLLRVGELECLIQGGERLNLTDGRVLCGRPMKP